MFTHSRHRSSDYTSLFYSFCQVSRILVGKCSMTRPRPILRECRIPGTQCQDLTGEFGPTIFHLVKFIRCASHTIPVKGSIALKIADIPGIYNRFCVVSVVFCLHYLQNISEDFNFRQKKKKIQEKNRQKF